MCHKLSDVGDGMINPLQGANELLQVCHIGRRSHGNQAVQTARVAAYFVGGDEEATPAELLCKEDVFLRLLLDLVLEEKLEERPNGLKQLLQSWRVDQDAFQLDEGVGQ